MHMRVQSTYYVYNCKHETHAYIHREYEFHPVLRIHFSSIISKNLTGDHQTS